MIAWLAARCDLPDYGKLIVYEFPKEKLVYGPFQIEALINQNTYISQQISLWNQMGSRAAEIGRVRHSTTTIRQSSACNPEIGRVRRGARRNARAFGGYDQAIRRSLRCH